MKKIHKKWQIFLYAASGIGVNLLNLMMGSYLCSAVVADGFGKEAVKNQTFAGFNLVLIGLWGAFVLISKIIDGVIDIPMASFTDRLRTRFGRRRPSIVIGFIPMIVAYVLIAQFTPDPSGATLLNTVFYGVMLCIFYTAYTLTMVTYYATFTEIVDNENDRNILANVKSVCDIFYFIIGYVAVSAFLRGMNIRIVSLIVLPLAFTMLIPLFMIKETKDSIGATGNAKSVNLITSLTHTLRNRDFVMWMCVYFFMSFGLQIFLSGINEYFSSVGLNMTLVMGASFSPVPAALLLYNHIIKKHGFGAAFRYTLLVYSLDMIVMFFTGLISGGIVKVIMSIFAGLICSLAVGALFSVAYSVPAQLAAEEEEHTGISAAAMYFAVQGLFAGVATGLGTGPVLNYLKACNSSYLVTLFAAVGTLAAFGMTFTLPKHVIYMGKTAKRKD